MSFEDEMRSALANFQLEAAELLAEMEAGLLDLEHVAEAGADAGAGAADETINMVFRAAHTVKGSAGLFGLDPIVKFTHVLESVLERVRSHELTVSPGLIGALLPCTDHVGSLVGSIDGGEVHESEHQAQAGAVLLVALQPYLAGDPAGHGDGDVASEPAPASASETGVSDTELPSGRMHLSLRFGADSLRSGMDPLSFIRYLSTLGEVLATTVIADLPDAAQLDPETCYLGFEITLATQSGAGDVESVFDFVREDSDIRVIPSGSPAPVYAELVRSYGEFGSQVAHLLVSTQAIHSSTLDDALAGRTSDTPVPVPRTVENLAATAPEVAAAQEVSAPAATGTPTSSSAPVTAAATAATPAAAGPAPQRRAADRSETQTIRVDADRLDRLIDAVGELVIAGAGAGLRASLLGDEPLENSLGEVMRLVEEVRDSALQLRMVPIGTTFGRFQRIVRDVSAQLSKDVGLVITGGDTEVDKALVEQIGDPLMHLVRNALDHGIESPQDRVAAGKTARGTMRLNAFHDSGSIVIEVQDDGGGISAERVFAKAVERGLIDPGTILTDKDIYGLIFEPGFSTADTVSNLSGRGVGMDVVKRNVTALRGTIEVESKQGIGTTFRIRLPLTLAIIDGFMVGVGSATFVIPLDRVVECVELPPVSGRRRFMDLRGEVLPFIRLRSLFSIPGERPRRENVVVVEYAGTKTGLVVDLLKGEFQTVIKPLGQLFGDVQGIGGSTILGNGDVALIIDVPMLVRSGIDQSGQLDELEHLAGIGQFAADEMAPAAG